LFSPFNDIELADVRK